MEPPWPSKDTIDISGVTSLLFICLIYTEGYFTNNIFGIYLPDLTVGYFMNNTFSIYLPDLHSGIFHE